MIHFESMFLLDHSICVLSSGELLVIVGLVVLLVLVALIAGSPSLACFLDETLPICKVALLGTIPASFSTVNACIWFVTDAELIH